MAAGTSEPCSSTSWNGSSGSPVSSTRPTRATANVATFRTIELCSGIRTSASHRIAEIRDNVTARIAEADREGWLGEAEGLMISLTGAQDKLAQIDRRTRTRTHAPVGLGMPVLSRTAALS